MRATAHSDPSLQLHDRLIADFQPVWRQSSKLPFEHRAASGRVEAFLPVAFSCEQLVGSFHMIIADLGRNGAVGHLAFEWSNAADWITPVNEAIESGTKNLKSR